MDDIQPRRMRAQAQRVVERRAHHIRIKFLRAVLDGERSAERAGGGSHRSERQRLHQGSGSRSRYRPAQRRRPRACTRAPGLTAASCRISRPTVSVRSVPRRRTSASLPRNTGLSRSIAQSCRVSHGVVSACGMSNGKNSKRCFDANDVEARPAHRHDAVRLPDFEDAVPEERRLRSRRRTPRSRVRRSSRPARSDTSLPNRRILAGGRSSRVGRAARRRAGLAGSSASGPCRESTCASSSRAQRMSRPAAASASAASVAPLPCEIRNASGPST